MRKNSFAKLGFMAAAAFGASMALQGCDDSKVDVECFTPDQCDDGFVCSEDHLCVEDSETGGDLCENNDDCDEGQVCNAQNVCEDEPVSTGCEDNDDCFWNETCSEEQVCVVDPDAPECEEADHCAGGQTCEDGQCMGSLACESNETCGVFESCVEERCEALASEEHGYRLRDFKVISPDIYSPGTCSSMLNIINMAAGNLANKLDGSSYEESIVLDLVDGDVGLFEGSAEASTPHCRVEEGGLDVCYRSESALQAQLSYGLNQEPGACFERPAADGDGVVNLPQLDIPEALIPTVQADTRVGCVASEEIASLTFDFLGMALPLTGASFVAETQTDAREAGLSNGILQGFLTAEAAKATVVPEDLPFIGGQTVASLLRHGEGGCESASFGFDRGPDADGNLVDGWWFQVRFTGEKIEWRTID